MDRGFLRLSAMAAASTIVAACGPAPATPPQGAATAPPAPVAPTAAPAAAVATVAATTAPVVAPGKYKEAPTLTEQVAAGKLPPVDERLPKNPYVPPHAWQRTVRPKSCGVYEYSLPQDGQAIVDIDVWKR